MIKKIFTLILLFCFLVGCSNDQVSTNIEIESTESFASFPLDINSEKTPLSSLIESVEVIPLEETENSLLPNISRIDFHKNRFLVLNKGEDEILCFDSKGQYLETFNRKGEGPEEYRDIYDFWVKADTLVIYELGASNLYRYTVEGDFIDVNNLGYRVGHINQIGDQYLAEMNFNAINDSLLYKYVVLDSELNPIHLYQKSEEVPDGMVLSSNNSVKPFKEGLLSRRMYNDTVYFYSSDKFQPLVHFDFADNWFWRDKPIRKMEDLRQIDGSGMVWDLSSAVGERFIFCLGIVEYSHWEYFLIDRRTGRSLRLDLPKNTTIDMTPLIWKNNELIAAVTASVLPDLIQQLEINKEPNNSENPALVKIKFKDSSEW